jgi:hypothetical protein
MANQPATTILARLLNWWRSPIDIQITLTTTLHGDSQMSSNSQTETVYSDLVSEVATLECVHATLSEWDLAGQPTGEECKIGSAELVLRQSIRRLNDIVRDVSNIAIVPGISTAPGMAIPPNRLCATDRTVTLENAHSVMELVNALHCNEGTSRFEMPVSGISTLALLRKMVQDSIRYATDVGYCEANRN